MVYTNGNYVCTLGGRPCIELGPVEKPIAIKSTDGLVSASAYNSAGQLLTSWDAYTDYASASIPMRKGETAKLVVEQTRQQTYRPTAGVTGLTDTGSTAGETTYTFTARIPYGTSTSYVSTTRSGEQYTVAGAGEYKFGLTIDRHNLGDYETYLGLKYYDTGWWTNEMTGRDLDPAWYKDNYTRALDLTKFASISITAYADFYWQPDGRRSVTATVYYPYTGGNATLASGSFASANSEYHATFSRELSGNFLSDVVTQTHFGTPGMMMYFKTPSDTNPYLYVREPGRWEYSGVLK